MAAQPVRYPWLASPLVQRTGLSSNDYAVQVPFTDFADKGDLRLDYQQNASNSWFLRISDRKENGVNYPSIPIPLDGQTNGKIRILDQQIALGYTHIFDATKIIDARLGLSRTKAGKYNLSIGNTAFSIPGLPNNPIVAGGLPSIGITNYSGFGRQSTNPQWQNPALLDPKVNFTWVKGKHSLKFGYEYEHVWMAVNDNNPLYGSWTYGGAYSNAGGASVADTYWADFLFGTTSAYQLANYFVVHLRQTLNSAYAQDDWKVSPNLTLNLGLRWEYGSPYSEQNNYISNFDPGSQTVLTITPGAVAGNGITPYSGGGTYGKTLVNPDLNDFAPRIGFAYAADTEDGDPRRVWHELCPLHARGLGRHPGDQCSAGAVRLGYSGRLPPTATNHCCDTAASSDYSLSAATRQAAYATADQGFPTGLVTAFNPATDNITYIPKNTRDSYVESYFLSVQQQLAKNTLLDIAYVGNHGVKLQGFLNANQTEPVGDHGRQVHAAVRQLAQRYYRGRQLSSTRTTMLCRCVMNSGSAGGLTLLNSFTWEHSLDNASASLEGNTPSPQDANNTPGGLLAVGLQPADR